MWPQVFITLPLEYATAASRIAGAESVTRERCGAPGYSQFWKIEEAIKDAIMIFEQQQPWPAPQLVERLHARLERCDREDVDGGLSELVAIARWAVDMFEHPSPRGVRRLRDAVLDAIDAAGEKGGDR